MVTAAQVGQSEPERLFRSGRERRAIPCRHAWTYRRARTPAEVVQRRRSESPPAPLLDVQRAKDDDAARRRRRRARARPTASAAHVRENKARRCPPRPRRIPTGHERDGPRRQGSMRRALCARESPTDGWGGYRWWPSASLPSSTRGAGSRASANPPPPRVSGADLCPVCQSGEGGPNVTCMPAARGGRGGAYVIARLAERAARRGAAAEAEAEESERGGARLDGPTGAATC